MYSNQECQLPPELPPKLDRAGPHKFVSRLYPLSVLIYLVVWIFLTLTIYFFLRGKRIFLITILHPCVPLAGNKLEQQIDSRIYIMRDILYKIPYICYYIRHLVYE